MVEPQTKQEPAPMHDNGIPDEPADRGEITRIMDEFSARMTEISQRNVPQQKSHPYSLTQINPDIDDEVIVQVVGNKKVIDLDRLTEEEDSEIFSQSRLRVQKATTSMTELQKELDKMEVYKKLLSMVRRGFSDARDRSYWNSKL